MEKEKQVVLTGGNSGIGFEAAKALYGKGFHVIFGSRNVSKNEEAVQKIEEAYQNSQGTIKSFKLDLSKRSSIEEFCQNVKNKWDSKCIIY